MMERYKKSNDYLARALKVTPGGAQTLSKRSGRFPEGAYPVALVSGDGAHVTDVDGNVYLDMICGLACMTLGYGFAPLSVTKQKRFADQVMYSVQRQLDKGGASFSLATELEAEVAEKICAMIPCAEMVRFTKTGSESTEAAIRIARKATGRDAIVTIAEGYHSWHSWFQALKPEHPGIPQLMEPLVQRFDYNDLSSLERVFNGFSGMLPVWLEGGDPNGIAAVILEPCHYEQPASGFLQGVRDLCAKYGAVLIFDEMVTGFRWANGGAQEYYGVTPDLACFGKACANGFPLSFVCGKRELMEHADVVSGTFGGEALSLAACNAVLDIYQSDPIIETLWARGEQFQQGFNDLASVMDIDGTNMRHYVECDGFAVKPRIRFHIGTYDDTDPQYFNVKAMSLFLQETAMNGVLWHPAGGNISAAMTKKDIEEALLIMAQALVVVKHALDSGDWSTLKGKPIQATPFVRK